MSGASLAQLAPAIAAPMITRLYSPSDFGTFAFVLATFGLLAPLACMRYELAILLPEDEERAAHVTLLCLTLASATAVLSFLVPAGLWLFSPDARIRAFTTLLVTMLPAGIAMLSIQLIADSWSLRTRNYRVQSIATVVQAFVTIGSQTLLGAKWGSSPYFLVFGTLAGSFAGVLSYLPVIQGQIFPRLKKYLLFAGALRMARHYSSFPIYAGPYAVAVQAGARGIFLVLGVLTSTAVVGQYALAQRVMFLPVCTLMLAASQLFFSRAAQKLDDPRMPYMVRTMLIAGPLTFGPIFMLVCFFGESIFVSIFGPAWQQAGRFAVILAVPSMAKSLTVWLERVYDIRGRQRLALILETSYGVIALATTYIALRTSGDAEIALETYAVVTVIYHAILLLSSLWVAKFDLRMGGEFLTVTIAMSLFMIAGDQCFRWLDAATLVRFLGDVLLALPIIAAGAWIASRRLGEKRPPSGAISF